MAGDEQQGESAAHAEADDANFAVQLGWARSQARAASTSSKAGPERAIRSRMTWRRQSSSPAFVVEVDREREKARLGEPVGLVAMVRAHAAYVVQDDDAGHGAWFGRNSEVSGHLAARR